MKRPLITAISGLLLTLFISGCTQTETAIDTTKLTPDENKLITIQDEVNAQLEKLNAELQKTPLNYDLIVSLASESSEFIAQSIKQVDDLADAIGNSKIVTDTKKVLTSAQMLVDKVKSLAADLKNLQNDLSQLADDAKKEIEAKIAETGKLLDGYKTRLADIKNRFNEIRQFFFGDGEESKSEAEKAVESKKSQATI